MQHLHLSITRIRAVLFLPLLFWVSATFGQLDYLGQKPPGKTPERFAPGLISTKYYEHSAPAFSPDGSMVLWTVIYERGKPARIMGMQKEKGAWSKPFRPAFADTTADDFYPSFSTDGNKLYFSSRRKLPAGYPDGHGMLRIWEVKRKDGGWEDPVPMDTAVFQAEDYAHSVTSSGTLYTSFRRQNGRIFDIAFYRKSGDHYQKPEVLPYHINTMKYEDGPFIAPDESYLIFESGRPGGTGSTDLYICFRKSDGTWSPARNMGPAINSPNTERFARVSPDGQYLFFGSDRNLSPGAEGADIYWVSASIIEKLKKQVLQENEESLGSSGNMILSALINNEWSKVAPLLKTWLAAHPRDVNGYVDYLASLRRSNQYREAEQELNRMKPGLPAQNDLQVELALIYYGLGKNREAEGIIHTLPSSDMEDRARFTTLAAALRSMGKYKESAALYQRALKVQPRGVDFYNMACSYALDGNRDQAFAALRDAVENDFKEKEQFESDTDLESLKSDQRWTTLVASLVSGLPPENPARPYARAHHEMVYHEADRSVLMVSGSTPLRGGQYSVFFNDIWQYNNGVWHKQGQAGDRRSGIRLAYDTRRHKLYSFGGFTPDNQSNGQLRVLENDSWEVLTDLPEMKAAEPGFVYDASRDKFIAFGGTASRGVAQGTTWEWDGVSWKKFEGVSPESRQAFAMVYDTKRSRTVLFGGVTGTGKLLDDLWEFDGKEWRSVQAASTPSPRLSPGYAYDSKRGLLLIFGGIVANGVKGDTWGWDGKEWKKLADTGPPARVMGYMAYDKHRDRVVLFGGRLGWPNDTDDTWEWDGSIWKEIKQN